MEQKRNRRGQFQSMPAKAKKISPNAPSIPKGAGSPLAQSGPEPAVARATKNHPAPRGHLGDGIRSLYEYTERTRKVYVAFVRMFAR